MEEEEAPPEPEKAEETVKADPIPDNVSAEDNPALTKPDLHKELKENNFKIPEHVPTKEEI